MLNDGGAFSPETLATATPSDSTASHAHRMACFSEAGHETS